MFKGWNSQAHREFPGNVESTNLSRDNISREIGRVLMSPASKIDNDRPQHNTLFSRYLRVAVRDKPETDRREPQLTNESGTPDPN